LLKDLGVPPRDTMEILGHARIAVTMEIYTNSRELHRMGEKPQVSTSRPGRDSVPCLQTAAV